MQNPNKFKLFEVVAFFAIIVIFIYTQYSQNSDTYLLTKKIEHNAKQIESLRMDIKTLSKSGVQNSTSNVDTKNNDMIYLQKKLEEMKNQVKKLKTNNDSSALTEYQKREEKIWHELAENIKQEWSKDLADKLAAKNFSEDDKNTVLYNYSDMLDRMKAEQVKWYRAEISDEEIKQAPLKVAKNFYNELAWAIGEQKASIVLSTIFPDHNFRKSLFEAEN